MFGAFGDLALVLAMVGLYSMLAYDVAQRRRQLGVRMALGARPGAVARLVMGEAERTIALGAGVGCAICLGD
jgi:putative ABC transport system permease protein